jgi:hypothetical protein
MSKYTCEQCGADSDPEDRLDKLVAALQEMIALETEYTLDEVILCLHCGQYDYHDKDCTVGRAVALIAEIRRGLGELTH